MTQEKRIRQIYEENHGFITSREVSDRGIPSFFLTQFIRHYGLVRIDRGFYASSSWPVDDYFVFQYRYPKFIYSYDSALYLYGLTDRIVSAKVVTAPNGYHPYRGEIPGVEKHFERNPELYREGISKVRTIFGNEVKAYDKDKTICDMIRRKKEMDAETFIKAIQLYSTQKGNPVRMMEYAKARGIESDVLEIMELVKKL